MALILKRHEHYYSVWKGCNNHEFLCDSFKILSDRDYTITELESVPVEQLVDTEHFYQLYFSCAEKCVNVITPIVHEGFLRTYTRKFGIVVHKCRCSQYRDVTSAAPAEAPASPIEIDASPIEIDASPTSTAPTEVGAVSASPPEMGTSPAPTSPAEEDAVPVHASSTRGCRGTSARRGWTYQRHPQLKQRWHRHPQHPR